MKSCLKKIVHLDFSLQKDYSNCWFIIKYLQIINSKHRGKPKINELATIKYLLWMLLKKEENGCKIFIVSHKYKFQTPKQHMNHHVQISRFINEQMRSWESNWSGRSYLVIKWHFLFQDSSPSGIAKITTKNNHCALLIACYLQGSCSGNIAFTFIWLQVSFDLTNNGY